VLRTEKYDKRKNSGATAQRDLIGTEMTALKILNIIRLHSPGRIRDSKRINRIQTDKQQRKSKQTNTHARNNKINEGKQHRNKTQMENMQSVTT
jgi:hypothetical protein